MSLNIDNKVYRNMQEQVAYNSTNIKKIADYIDGLDVQDSVIVLESLSPLNSEQMKVAEQPLAFIVYGEAVYLKTKEDATYYYFEKMLKMELGTYVTLSSAVIQVTKLNGATGITVSSVVTYAKGQLDTLLAGKVDTATLASYATLSYVNIELAKKADLTGASFSGPITSPSIIEDMTGYQFYKMEMSGWTQVINYAGAVKNGNKLTLALALTVTKGSGAITYGNLGGEFKIPHEIMEKIFPAGVDNYLLQILRPYAIYDANGNGTELKVKVRKLADYDRIDFYLVAGAGAMTADTPYYLRMEITFLLSPSLAS